MGFAQLKLVLLFFLRLHPKMRPKNSWLFFFSSQLEERAMEELLQYYGGLDNACEFVTVQRVPTTAARPVWKKERLPSVTSG